MRYKNIRQPPRAQHAVASLQVANSGLLAPSFVMGIAGEVGTGLAACKSGLLTTVVLISSRDINHMPRMDNSAIFWIQIVTSVFVFGTVAVWYVWPSLTKLSRNSALVPLLFVHVFRYVGMTLLVTDMIDPKLPREFLSSAAYGDLLEAALAFAAIFALRSNVRVAIPLVWAANTWGFVDLLNGLRGVLQWNVPSFNLASFWYVYTFYAPFVVVSHLLIFWTLIKSRSREKQAWTG